jgi:hypothetical protein
MNAGQQHVAIHTQPDNPIPGPVRQYDARRVETLAVAAADLSRPLPVTFDEAISTLESWNCMLIEPDGSLVWADSSGRRPWRIDIQLQDGREGLQYVEIKTNAPRPPCARLLTAFGQATQPLMVQLVLEGIFLSAVTWLDLLEPGETA